MKLTSGQSGITFSRSVYLLISAIVILILAGPGSGSVKATPSGPGSTSGKANTAVVCPDGQCFTDVPAANGFYAFINALYMDSIISGYACGGTGEPCDGQSRPYYRPNNNVTRAQMSKFVDNGRRNIADAVGTSLIISGTQYNTLSVTSNSSGSAIVGACIAPNTACYAVAGGAPAGDYGGYFAGGRGVYAGSQDSSRPALDTVANGISSYGVNAFSQSYRGLGTDRGNTAYFSLYVDRMVGEPTGDGIAEVAGSMEVVGNLTVDGSKGGYVVDAMQNVDTGPLEPGDVVVIAGSAAPVLGKIPVVTIKKADTAYSTNVVGVVDQALYVPDAATKAAYEKQQEAQRIAQAAHAQAMQDASATGSKPNEPDLTVPEASITDAQGTVHATDATSIPTDGYTNVVTLGSYMGVKVDASFGAIHAGDLLTTSPHAGYAMKVTDRSQAFGATIGKALADIETGTGIIPVMVTLK